MTTTATRSRAELRKVYRAMRRELAVQWRGVGVCNATDIRALCLSGFSRTPTGADNRDEELALTARLISLYKAAGQQLHTCVKAVEPWGWQQGDTLYRTAGLQFVLLKLIKEQGGTE